jgi:hypothetical protein
MKNKTIQSFMIFLISIFLISIASAIPDPGHSAEEIGAGTFDLGNFVFQSNLSVDSTDLFVNSNLGRVGIGTSTPEDKLDIGDGNIVLDNSYGLKWGTGDPAPSISGSNSTGILSFQTNTAWRMAINENGYVGIGINPQLASTTLDVGSGVFTVNATSGKVGINTKTPSQTLNVVGDLNVTGTSYLGNVKMVADNITTNNILAKTDNIQFWAENNPRMFVGKISGEYRVGIGTSYPLEELDVNGSSSWVRVKSTSATGSSTISFRNDQDKAAWLLFGGSSAASSLFGVNWANGMLFYTNDGPLAIGTNANAALTLGTNGIAAMTIDTSQKVGIGTTTPTDTLNVNGTMKVDNSTGSAVLFVTTNGKVGIGTDNPQQKLQVGNHSAQYALIVTPGATYVSLGAQNSSGYWNHLFLGAGYVYIPQNVGISDAAPDGPFEVNPDTSEDSGDEFLIKSNGDVNIVGIAYVNKSTSRVGIGTTNPLQKLSVNGNFYIVQNNKQCWNDACTAYEYYNGTNKIEVYP